MIGKQILHYAITAKLGEGGMGVVFKAEDTRLKRPVALKFLPRRFSPDSLERQRFEREARAAAALTHAHIAQIYTIEESDGEPFIVMEYVDGRELRAALADGPMPYERVLNVAGQIASALKAAHDRGIVHRDIKSANIMLANDGVVKVMDFGLARVGCQDRLTQNGMVVGTVDYMSPEQVRGEAVDHRTDIWSLGVVLYEMLGNQRPFRGDYDQAVMYSILNENPPALSTAHSGMARLVTKMLARNREDRFHSMADVIRELDTLRDSMETRTQAGIAASPPKPSLAVLPFASVRDDPEVSFLGFALADQVIGALTYAGGIMVRPSSAVRKYQQQGIDAPTAGRELQVDYVLGGYYLKESDTIRLNIELVAAQANEIVWRDSIQVQYENTFKLQDIVSEKVLHGLNVRFSGGKPARATTDEPNDPIAYEYYLRAVSYPLSLDGNQLAMKMLDVAIARDPRYAPAYAERGFRLNQLAIDMMMGMKGFQEVEDALKNALSLNPNLLPALWDLTFLYVNVGRTEEAIGPIQHLLQVAPGTALPHFALGYLYRYVGMLEESVQQIEKALALDPKNPRFRSAGFTYFYMGDYQKAYAMFELDRHGSVSIGFRGLCLLVTGQRDRAIEHFDRVIAMEPQSFLGRRFAVIRAVTIGQRDEAVRLMNAFSSVTASETDSEHWYLAGEAHAMLGDSVSCIRMLSRAVDGGFFNYRAMLVSPFLESVRQDPGFQQVVEHAREKHEQFKRRFTQQWAALLTA